jgi:hypothetical protein
MHCMILQRQGETLAILKADTQPSQTDIHGPDKAVMDQSMSEEWQQISEVIVR